MRILVADQNALLLAAIASTFGRHCVIVTETRREACLEHLTRDRIDVVVACEKLRDYTGLELLSEVETLSPHSLRIFAAPAPHLARLGARLDHFGLLGTLSYPIEARKLLVALKVARTKLPARPKVRHVVLESEWDTGERLGILERELEVAPADPPVLAAAPGSEGEDVATVPAAAAAPDAGDVPILEYFEETWVSRVQRIQEIPQAEVSFEVSFDENPNRFDATAVRAPGVMPPSRPVAPLPTAARAPDVKPSLRSQTVPAAAVPTLDVKPPSRPIAPLPTTARASDAKPPLKSPALPPTAVPTLGVKPPSRPVAPLPKAAQAPDEVSPPLPLPPVDTGSAANDPAFVAGPTETPPSRSGSKTATAAAHTEKAPAAKKTATTGPRARRQAIPTAAQREAFQRAVARRNAERIGLPSQDETNTGIRARMSAADTPSAFRPHWHGTHSLSDLASMTATRRPLAHTQSTFQPTRKVFVVGSGVAAVLLASVLAFQLTRSHTPTHQGRRAVAAQLFAPHASMVAANNATEAPQEVFGAPPGQPEPAATPSPASNGPQPQVFNPDTAPADPPPPPALEHPGPMEPPSMAHNEEPPWMQRPPDAD
jgi:DNA-binding NarL/FixJ family response regulator